jgi:hypothetical protein
MADRAIKTANSFCVRVGKIFTPSIRGWFNPIILIAGRLLVQHSGFGIRFRQTRE